MGIPKPHIQHQRFLSFGSVIKAVHKISMDKIPAALHCQPVLPGMYRIAGPRPKNFLFIIPLQTGIKLIDCLPVSRLLPVIADRNLRISGYPVPPALHLIQPQMMKLSAGRRLISVLTEYSGKSTVIRLQILPETFHAAGTRILPRRHTLPRRDTYR